MTDTPDAVVTDLPVRGSLWARNKTRIAKVATITGVALLGGVYLKRKLNCSCDVEADVHVESADQPSNS